MSPIVVGTNNSPATAPHKYDCGFRKTIAYGRMREAQPEPDDCGRDSDGEMKKSNIPTTTHAVPSQCQMDCQTTPCSSQGPTTNCPAAPPSIPMHCVTPMALGARAEM